MGKAETHLYIKFTNLLKDEFGYKDVLGNGGDAAYEELMNYGTIAGPDGKRVEGDEDRKASEREWDIAKLLEDGEPLYIYRNGDKYPTRIRYNKNTDEIEVDPKPINEMPMPPKPEKPGLFWRIFNIIPRMFGSDFPSMKRWKDYNREIEARKNVVDRKRVDRRTNYYKLIKDKYTSKEATKNEPAKEAVKEASKEAQPQAEKTIQKQADRNAQIESLFGISAEEAKKRTEAARAKNEETAKTPEQQLWALKAQRLELDKQIAELEKQIQQPAKEEPEKPGLETIDEVDESLEDDEPESLIDDDEPENLVDDDEPEILVDEDVDLIGLAELEKMADERRAAESAQGTGGNQDDVNTEQKEAPASTVEILIDNLEADGNQLSDVAKGNLWALYLNAQQGKKEIEEAVNNPNVERISGGEAVTSMVAFENVKNALSGGNKQQMLDALDREGAAKDITKITRVSKDVVYASDYEHGKDFFKKNFLEADGLGKMTKSVDDSAKDIINKEKLFGIKAKDPLFEARVKAEKQAQQDEQQKKMQAQQGGMTL